MATKDFKTPRPVPVFYSSSSSCSFSTKKQRRVTYYKQSKVNTIVRTLPLVSRIFTEWWIAKKPQPITFKNHDASYSGDLSCEYYDESISESYFKQCFIVEAKIGEGSFGEVFKVRCKENGRLYAVKKSLDKFRSATDREEKLDEVRKHEQLPKHPNLVRFIRAWEELGWLYIQTELCKTSLNNFSENFHELPESVVRSYLVDLLLAVKHLHDYNLIHLDIKPENIFIDNLGVLKLGDFGLVTDLSIIQEGAKSVPEGDSKYLSPELLNGNPVGKHVDIFSLGITILEIACDLDLPSQGDLWHLLRSGELPEEMMKGLSFELNDIIHQMMNPDWTKRPSAAEILNHPYIKEAADKRVVMIAFKKLVNMLKSIRLLFFVYGSFYLSRPSTSSRLSSVVRHNASSLVRSGRQRPRFAAHQGQTESNALTGESSCSSSVTRFKRKNLNNLSYSTAGKRKLTVISSSPVSVSSPLLNDGEPSKRVSRDQSPSSPFFIPPFNLSEDDDTTAAFEENEIFGEPSSFGKRDANRYSTYTSCSATEDQVMSIEDEDYINNNKESSSSDEFYPALTHNPDSTLEDSCYFVSKPLKPWNSTPAHDKLKRRILVDDETLDSTVSSPILSANRDNCAWSTQARTSTLSGCQAKALEADDSFVATSTTEARPTLNALAHSFSTPDDLLSSKKRFNRVFKSPVKNGLTPKNLLQEFEDDSF